MDHRVLRADNEQMVFKVGHCTGLQAVHQQQHLPATSSSSSSNSNFANCSPVQRADSSELRKLQLLLLLGLQNSQHIFSTCCPPKGWPKPDCCSITLPLLLTGAASVAAAAITTVLRLCCAGLTQLKCTCRGLCTTCREVGLTDCWCKT